MMKHPAVKYLLAVIFTAVALYLAFRKTDFTHLVDEIADINVPLILAGTGVMFLSHLVRAWRYKMFSRPIKGDMRVSSSFKALIAGYAMNNVIPRSGDIVRPVLLSKREEIPVTGAVAGLLIERLSDLIGLSFVLILSLLIFREEIAVGFPAIYAASIPIIIVLTLLFAFGLLILFSEKATVRVIHFLTQKFPEKARAAIENATSSLEHGLREARTGAAIPLAVGTLGIWLLYSLSMFVSIWAFKDANLNSIGFTGCILLQTLSGLAFTVPTPGGMGTYHFFISQSLAVIFGVNPTVAVAYATVTHASNYILTTVIGLFFMISEGISLGDVTKNEGNRTAVIDARRSIMGRNSGTHREAIQSGR